MNEPAGEESSMHLAFFSPPGASELLLFLIIVLLLFGARRLPELARSLGKSLGEFRKGRQEGERESGTDEASTSKPDPK